MSRKFYRIVCSILSRLSGQHRKNNISSIAYRYAEVGSPLPTSWTSITGYGSTVVFGNTNDSKVEYLKNTINNYFISKLPIQKSYNFEFKITDKIQSVILTLTVEQGIPIIEEFDDGHVSIGKENIHIFYNGTTGSIRRFILV